MKSILFSMFRDKLLDGSKTQTYRLLFIPTYDIGEIIKTDFRDTKNKRETLFLAKIKDIYPKQIKDLTLEEAVRDCFENAEDFQTGIMELHKIENVNRWGFIIRFRKHVDITLEKFLGVY